jgi:ABC-type lipoprotein release transport system permease subunit
MTWKEMMPEVVQQIEADNASGIIMLGILYMIVGFGILGTVLMMINERRREFGMLVAVGMQKVKLIRIVLMELCFIGLIGIAAGLATATPLILYYYVHPIPLTGEMAQTTIQMGFEPLMPTAWKASYFIGQTVTVMAIILLVMILPALRISRLKVIDSMRK